MASPDTQTRSQKRNIVIIGGGIIGCTTAYYLTRHPTFSASDGNVSITILEASLHGAAQGASGKAGGLVAKWAYPAELVRVSFEEHVKLAQEHNGKERWGWREVECGQWDGRGDEGVVQREGHGIGGKSLEKREGLDGGDVGANDTAKRRRSKGLPLDLDWMEERLTDSYSPMAKTGDTAQVHPYQFTTSILDLAVQAGVHFVKAAKVTSVNTSGEDGISEGSSKVSGVTYEDFSNANTPTTIDATDVIVCAGAWSPHIAPFTTATLPISHTRAHSITIQPQPNTPISPYVLFTSIALPDTSKPSQTKAKRRSSTTASPEIYARPGPNYEIYICGSGDNDLPFPPTVDGVLVSKQACEDLWTYAASVSVQMREGIVDKKQACYLPLGGPIVGRYAGVEGVVIATGHTCWGICNAPGTAKAVSELVFEGRVRCADLSSLKP